MELFNWARPTVPVRPARLEVTGPLGLSAQGQGAGELAPMATGRRCWLVSSEPAARGGWGAGQEAPWGLRDSILGVTGRSISLEQSLSRRRGPAGGE
jgi:hypothetical protein